MYAQGEQVHIATWPGAVALTEDISRFIAMEGRVYVMSVSGVLKSVDIPRDFPLREHIMERGEVLNNGGTMIVSPAGSVLCGPVVDEETILYAELSEAEVIQEHLRLDPAGHYSRSDVFQLTLRTERLDPLR